MNFIPTLATMILGLIAGRWLQSEMPRIPYRRMLISAFACILVGAALHYAGICPIVKKVWTPSWTLFSGGFCFLFLCAFSFLLDGKLWRPAFPLIVIGRNSITAYVLADLLHSFFEQSLYTHFGHRPFQLLGMALEPLLLGLTILLIYWLILYWMYRRNLFLRI